MTRASVEIDQDMCMASGYCISRLRSLFVETADGVAAVRSGNLVTAGPITVPSKHIDAVDKAALECPTGAILVTGNSR